MIEVTVICFEKKGGRKIVTHIIFSQDAKWQAFTCIPEQKNTF